MVGGVNGDAGRGEQGDIRLHVHGMVAAHASTRLETFICIPKVHCMPQASALRRASRGYMSYHGTHTHGYSQVAQLHTNHSACTNAMLHAVCHSQMDMY